MAESFPPFSCTHTTEVPDILGRLGCTLALSTYQAGKVILLSAKGEGLVQLSRTFQKPMGMAVQDQKMAIALQNEVLLLVNDARLGKFYPRKPDQYDGFFVPRAVYYSGELNLHDLAFGAEGLWAVNTRFSCLSLIDDRFSFQPRWRPPFISDLTPDDRCHLNGLAMDGGEPVYVTGLGETDTGGGWRENRLAGGFLMHVKSREMIARNLSMPHSPRIYDGNLFFLNSAAGELMRVDPASGVCEVVNRLPGFARGMARCGDYLFVGLSKIRAKHMFSDMPVAKEGQNFAGIILVHLPSGRLAGSIRYLSACEEIYDIQVLPGLQRPGILNHTTPTHQMALSLPEMTFWAEPGQDAGNERQAGNQCG